MATPYQTAIVPKVAVKTVGATASILATVSQLAIEVTFEANTANTGIIYIGDSGVDATASIHLTAGDSKSVGPFSSKNDYNMIDLAGWYAAASAAGQKMSITRQVRHKG